MRRILTALSCLLLIGWVAGAQTSREELLSHIELTAGNYANYPNPTGHLTPAPDGYEPFYISHYGRHGSRYMTSDKSYKRLKEQLDSAKALGILTPYGKDVRRRVRAAAADARGRAGELTALGARQHRAIARRMFDNYPTLLGQPVHIVANSSTSRRVMLSMAYFCNELKALNPSLEISMDASEHDQYYIKTNKTIVIPESPANNGLKRKYNEFKKRMLSGEPQMEAIFTDPKRAKKFIDQYSFADDLFKVAIDMYCLPELNISFFDLFGEEGMIDGFRAQNASWCFWEGIMPGADKVYYRAFPLLQNFLDEADEMIASGESGVRLRFGHDSGLLMLSYLFGVGETRGVTDDMDNLHKYFSTFRIIPMAGNLQLIFFRKAGSDDILVKFLMNENETSIPLSTDCYPYYHWSDIEPYYRNMIESANIVYQAPKEDED
jgi:hypothetical protein